jgi:hypothetical protein
MQKNCVAVQKMEQVIHSVKAYIRVYITAQDLLQLNESYSISQLLLRKIKQKHEKVCTKDGFILSISETDLKYSAGNVPPEHLNGNFVYNVQYVTQVCNPTVNQEIPVVVTSFNKIGMMCHYFPFEHEHDEDETPHETETGTDILPEETETDTDILPEETVDDDERLSLVDSHTYAKYHKYSNCIVVLVPKALNLTHEIAKKIYTQAESRLKENDTLKLRLNVKILQKRFDINDKQITAVGMLVESKTNDPSHCATQNTVGQ